MPFPAPSSRGSKAHPLDCGIGQDEEDAKEAEKEKEQFEAIKAKVILVLV